MINIMNIAQYQIRVENGDLLVTGVGTIGVPFLIKDNTPLYFKDGNIIWLKNRGSLDEYFLFYSFINANIQSYIKKWQVWVLLAHTQ